MNYAEKREKALIIFEEQIGLIPSDIQIQCAIWDCQSEMREVAEEIVEWLRAARAYPNVRKREIFFGDD